MDVLTLLVTNSANYIFTTPWWVLLVQILLLWIVYFAVKGIYFLLSIRFTGRYRQPSSFDRGTGHKILLAGDSTAVGTGAKDAHQTLGAFLSRDFPQTTIINKGVNGATTSQVADVLAKMTTGHFDLVLVSTGGNDVWAFTRKMKLRKAVQRVLLEAIRLSDGRAILLFFGNEGSAPFFPWLLKGTLLTRTEMVRSVFEEECEQMGVPFIELFSQPRENPFVSDPNTHFAPDGLHPNEIGYWNWYKRLWRLMVQDGYLYREQTPSLKRVTEKKTAS